MNGSERPGSGQPATVWERQLAVLSQDYPAWQIRRVVRPDGSFGGWWATRRAALTEEQRAAGLFPSIARRDVVALISELAVQDDIAHRHGYARKPAAARDPASLGCPQ